MQYLLTEDDMEKLKADRKEALQDLRAQVLHAISAELRVHVTDEGFPGPGITNQSFVSAEAFVKACGRGELGFPYSEQAMARLRVSWTAVHRRLCDLFDAAYKKD